MSNEKKPYPSRLKNKKNKSNSNSILNGMIGLVFALIIITGAFIFLDNDDEEASQTETVEIDSGTEQQTSENNNNEEQPAAAAEEDADNDSDESAEASTDESEDAANDSADEKTEETDKTKEGTVTKGGTITREKSNDPIVNETVINTSWEPVGTVQTGDHTSVYDESSVDWKEKIDAISYATGLSADNMYVMRLQNGGGPQKSIGVVQSKDTSEKYRVHLEWVDSKGWKPVKMDVLKTIEGAY